MSSCASLAQVRFRVAGYFRSFWMYSLYCHPLWRQPEWWAWNNACICNTIPVVFLLEHTLKEITKKNGHLRHSSRRKSFCCYPRASRILWTLFPFLWGRYSKGRGRGLECRQRGWVEMRAGFKGNVSPLPNPERCSWVGWDWEGAPLL